MRRMTKTLFNKRVKRRRVAGFSLIEIVVVIAIMAILLVVLTPSLLSNVESSRAQKDESAMDEVVNAVQLALSDSGAYDEMLRYSCDNNYITYTDSSGSYGSKINDEEFWAPDGSSKATTITFNPQIDGFGKTKYTMDTAIVNDMTYGNGSSGDPRSMVGAKLESSQCYLKNACAKDDTKTAYVYNQIKQTIGDSVVLTSQTYRNSSFTIFIKWDQVDGTAVPNVYGYFNGTNLSEDSPASVGSGTSYDENDELVSKTPEGGLTTTPVFNQSDLNGGGTVTPDYKETVKCAHEYEMTTTASCTTAGITTYTCTKCGDTYSEETPEKHTFDNADDLTCNMCGTTFRTYAFKASSYDSLMGTTTATDAVVIIPATFQNGNTYYKVTSVASSGFKNCTNLTSVTIPDTVQSIGYYGFGYCSNLKEINFSNSKNLTKFDIWAFYGCRGLTEIIIPEGVQSIGMQAYYACPNVKKVHIPSTLTGDIDGDNFYKSVIVDEITVHPDNPVYHSDGNCLIKTAEKSIVFGCPNSVIPTDGSVTAIGGNRAFVEMEFENFIIPEAVTFICKWAFSNAKFSNITFENTDDWYVTQTEGAISGTTLDVTKTSTNAYNLSNRYSGYCWYRTIKE